MVDDGSGSAGATAPVREHAPAEYARRMTDERHTGAIRIAPISTNPILAHRSGHVPGPPGAC
mgnify:CR=1 FL=1